VVVVVLLLVLVVLLNSIRSGSVPWMGCMRGPSLCDNDDNDHNDDNNDDDDDDECKVDLARSTDSDMSAGSAEWIAVSAMRTLVAAIVGGFRVRIEVPYAL